jgi:hypothetical protein
MSDIQQNQIKDAGENICGKKMSYDSAIRMLELKEDHIQKLKALIKTLPEGSEGDYDAELNKLIEVRDARFVKVDRFEKKIKKLQGEYEKLLNSKPLPNRKIIPAMELKRKSAAAIEKVKNDILESMKDPNSAQFRRIVTNGVAVCGEVNAKNSMGGYVGFKKFINWDDDDEITDFTFYEDKAQAEFTSNYCEKLAK